MPLYLQMAIHFADIHDTATCMQEKGVITDVVPWKKSRTVLYWRMRRRLLQENVKQDVVKVKPGLGEGQIDSMLRRWFVEDKGTVDGYLWEDNQAVANWLMEQLDPSNQRSIIKENISALRRDTVISTIRGLLTEHPEAAMESVGHLIQQLTPAQRSDLSRSMAADAPES
jgi:hypothetical protein